MSEQESVPEAYRKLEEQTEPIVHLANARMQLGWDQQVMMPEGGTPARSKQISTLSRLEHDLKTDPEIGELLETLEDKRLERDHAANAREARREYERAVSVPRELVEEISETASNAHPIWKNAREEDDFETFQPILQEIIELRREYAHEIDPDRDPYAVLFESYEPYLSLEKADEVLQTLREELVPLIDDIQESGKEITTDAFEGEFAPSDQEELVRETLDLLGYDWEHGRMDTAPHPFSSGNQYDARVTTRFDESDVLAALSSTIHEFGHAHYTLGLPKDAYGTPLGQSRNLSVHESQSRFWENHVGRTRAFWEFFLPRMAEHFPELEAVSVDEAYEAANQVYTDNLIRVEADELTYHLHIVIRYEIEQDLIRGDLDVEDVPAVWNDKYEEYLGVRPETDADGCLQDIHWSNGSFGYFPTYSLGSVMAAQIAAAMERDLGELDAHIRDGDFEPVTEWLRSEIHQQGRRYTTPDLVEVATGEPYTATYFTEYVTEKYESLYGL